MKSNFWKNKRVLITGYEGFLGSNLTKALLGRKAKISGLDILTQRKKTILSAKELAQIEITRGSVENFSLVSKIIEDQKVEFIFHLAAKSLVGYCLENPLKTFSTNIRGTWNILEASRLSRQVKGIVVSSSDKAYGCNKNLPYQENFPLWGDHPYDVSKACADLLANTYFHTYKLPVCLTRCGNIYGPGDFNFSRIVPDTIRSIIKNKQLIIRSNGNFIRDYIYIEDVVGAYLLLAEKLETLKLFGETFNFSNEMPLSVLNLVKLIYKIAARATNYKIINQANYEIVEQYLCAKKAKKLLGFKPQYTFESGLKKTLDWYKKVLN